MPFRSLAVRGRRCAFLALSSGLLAACLGPAGAATITVTDHSTFVGANSVCSLARALTYINAGADTDSPLGYCQISGTFGVDDTIVFNIGTGTPSITVTSNNVTYIEIPNISTPVTIDGGTGGATRVEILKGATAFNSAIRVRSNNVTLKNLVVRGFMPYAIDVGAYDGITIQGSYLNLLADGLTPTPPRVVTGIALNGSSHVLIGGTDPAQRNVIGGGDSDGIRVNSGSHDVQIFGNYIGVGADGQTAVGNCGDGSDFGCAGISVSGTSHDIQIGSSLPNTGNVISANKGDGVRVDGFSGDPTGVSISGNFIGVAADGTTPRGNGGAPTNYHCGVKMLSQSDSLVSNTVGGTLAGSGNLIANNAYCGVLAFGGSAMSGAATHITDIERNTIYANGTIGIDLSAGLYGDGATANDANGHADGANLFQNTPVLAHTWFTPGNKAYVSGSLTSAVTPNQSVRIEVYGNAAGGNQAENYLGAFGMITPASGIVSFKDQGPFTLPAGAHDISLSVTTDNGSSELATPQTASPSSDILFANSVDVL